MKISLVIPCYNEEDVLEDTLREVHSVLKGIPATWEIILVDDGSKDNTWEKIKMAKEGSNGIICIRFSRNFGKEAAIHAGLSFASGDCAIVMDADLQHPPSLIPRMLELWKDKGFKVVQAIKTKRPRESLTRRIGAMLFYGFLSRASRMDLHGTTDFMLLDREVVEQYLALPEKTLFFRGLVLWSGFERAVIPFECKEVEGKKSSWSLFALVRQAVSASLSFTSFPLHVVTLFGVLTFFFSLILGAQTIYNKITGNAVEGFTTVIILILFIGSVIMLSLGIIGAYIAKLFEEVKSRPRYIIEEGP